MSEWKARRFWDAATVEKADQGHTVHLDGRPVRTPAKRPLVVPTEALAREIAAEWDAQEGVIDPRAMPFTQSANAAIDKVAVQKDEVADMIAAYGESDLLCYRAEAPAELAARQAAEWTPYLDWAESDLSAPLIAVNGVMPHPQDPRAVRALRERVRAQDIFALTALHDLVSLSGSLILGLAAQMGRAAPEELWRVSRVDEDWQREQWGDDEEAAALAARKKAAFLHAARFFVLSRD
ncbi:ATPase [Roseovarius sp. SCSIO 43702]|uniref:ATP12 family chaperone protein n=1 Tax=Roseovarius sp. SCSIO 43702 TaxID=2823043 RepID=UPI001C731BEB|nr:ATP12 family protein [Roseovarius sp. SCSIO 43702]QYX56735.1 ATPase [Roseovarius sp. SCSIO 43702]